MSWIKKLFGLQEFLINFEVKHRPTDLVTHSGCRYKIAPNRSAAINLVRFELEKEYEGKYVDVIVH